MTDARIDDTKFSNSRLEGAAFTDKTIEEARLMSHSHALHIWNKDKEKLPLDDPVRRSLANLLIGFVQCSDDSLSDESSRDEVEKRIYIRRGLVWNGQMRHVGSYYLV
jgi:hypothetical protein